MSEPIRSGRYTARVSSHELTSTRNGAPRYTVEFVIQQGAFEGRRVRASYTLESEKAEAFLIRQLKFLGWNGQDFGRIELAHDRDMQIDVKATRGTDGKDYAEAIVVTEGVGRFAMQGDARAQVIAKMNARLGSRHPGDLADEPPPDDPDYIPQES